MIALYDIMFISDVINRFIDTYGISTIIYTSNVNDVIFILSKRNTDKTILEINDITTLCSLIATGIKTR